MPTRKPKKLENEWACTHSKTEKAWKRVDLRPLETRKNVKTSGPVPTRKPKKLENEWACAHSKTEKTWKRVGLHPLETKKTWKRVGLRPLETKKTWKRVGLRPLVRIKLFQSSGEENRSRIKKVYFHGQNLQYMQNLQREWPHSFFKKVALRVGLRPLKNRKNLKTSGSTPTQNY